MCAPVYRIAVIIVFLLMLTKRHSGEGKYLGNNDWD